MMFTLSLSLWPIYFLLVVAVAAETTTKATTCNVGVDDSCSSNNPYLDAKIMRWIDELPTQNSIYLNGAWAKPTSTSPDNDAIEVVDPSTGQKIAQVAVANKHDVDIVVASARQALEGWSVDTTIKERQYLVSRLLHLYSKNAEQMAQLITHEMGAPIDFSRDAQVGSGSFVMDQFLYEVGDEGEFESSYQLDDEEDTMIFHQAIGVVGLITPWNWPMNQIALKVIPALLVGCTVILKPSEQTPLSALLFGRLIHESGFPPGVFQLVNGYGQDHVGEWLASHPNIDMVSFTGSTRGGKQVSMAAAPTLKRVSLEMGGKGANIIFEDLVEDKDDKYFRATVENGVWEVMSNSGQTCNAPTRMLVHNQHWELALNVAKEIAISIGVGSAHVEGENIGPVVSQAQYERIQHYIQSGIDQGATLLVGGIGKPTIEGDDGSSSDNLPELQRHYQDGYYVRPTIFTHCTPNMTIWQEEIFGPVLCMTKFNSEQEAIALANDSIYGLTHYVHTYDNERKKRLAHKLQSGMIVMNQVGLASSAPFGGIKQSGNSREGGLWGLQDFCIVKAISGIYSFVDDDEY